MKKFDPNKPLQTRDGKPARIVALNANHNRYPIIALVTDEGQETPASYSATGQIGSEESNNPWDLINVPERKTVTFWINVYQDGVGSLVNKKRSVADAAALPNRVACIQVTKTYFEGDGL